MIWNNDRFKNPYALSEVVKEASPLPNQTVCAHVYAFVPLTIVVDGAAAMLLVIIPAVLDEVRIAHVERDILVVGTLALTLTATLVIRGRDRQRPGQTCQQ
jgi:hypothetical protein